MVNTFPASGHRSSSTSSSSSSDSSCERSPIHQEKVEWCERGRSPSHHEKPSSSGRSGYRSPQRKEPSKHEKPSSSGRSGYESPQRDRSSTRSRSGSHMGRKTGKISKYFSYFHITKPFFQVPRSIPTTKEVSLDPPPLIIPLPQMIKVNLPKDRDQAYSLRVISLIHPMKNLKVLFQYSNIYIYIFIFLFSNS